MNTLINYWELSIILLGLLSLLTLWIGKWLMNKYYINKARNGLAKTEKLYGASASRYVKFWKEYLKNEEKLNKL